jgi:hypothetical protein
MCKHREIAAARAARQSDAGGMREIELEIFLAG